MEVAALHQLIYNIPLWFMH